MQIEAVANCSFGKDSLAAILTAIEHGINVKCAIYVRIMFDQDIPAELPEHDNWVQDYAIPRLYNKYGIRTEIINPKYTYMDIFYRRKTRGKFVGGIYGFPMRISPWCNSKLKVQPLHSIQLYKNLPSIVGIAADEIKRIQRKAMEGKILPLVDHGITESMAYDMCKSTGLLSPIYRTSRRTGCWFCHNQSIQSLRNLYKYNRPLFERLLELEKVSPVCFRTDVRLHDLASRFSLENDQYCIFSGKMEEHT